MFEWLEVVDGELVRVSEITTVIRRSDGLAVVAVSGGGNRLTNLPYDFLLNLLRSTGKVLRQEEIQQAQKGRLGSNG